MPTAELTISLPGPELAQLEALAAEWNTTPQQIAEAFLADLTGSSRNGGSDERLFARQWFDRCCMPAFSEGEQQEFIGRGTAEEVGDRVVVHDFLGRPLEISLRDDLIFVGNRPAIELRWKNESKQNMILEWGDTQTQISGHQAPMLKAIGIEPREPEL